jgi:hypothetical protein
MDYRTQKELLGETRLSALFSPLLANRWLWVEAIIIPDHRDRAVLARLTRGSVLREQG